MAPTIQNVTDAGKATAASVDATMAARIASRQLSAEISSKAGVARAVRVPDMAGKIDISTKRPTSQRDLVKSNTASCRGGSIRL